MDNFRIEMKEWSDVRRIQSFYSMIKENNNKCIEFNFEGAAFIDSAVFQLLLSLRQSKTWAERVRFLNVTDNIKENAALLGLNTLFA